MRWGAPAEPASTGRLLSGDVYVVRKPEVVAIRWGRPVGNNVVVDRGALARTNLSPRGPTSHLDVLVARRDSEGCGYDGADVFEAEGDAVECFPGGFQKRVGAFGGARRIPMILLPDRVSASRLRALAGMRIPMPAPVHPLSVSVGHARARGGV